MGETPEQRYTSKVPPRDEQPPHSVEEQARTAKLEAETALVREQLQQAQRANAAAAREAQSWHACYAFVPTPRVALQALAAGIVLVGVLFFLYPPLMDTFKLKSELAILQTQIQGKQNEIQKQINADLSAVLQEQRRQMSDQGARHWRGV
jgi:hypothetical protein